MLMDTFLTNMTNTLSTAPDAGDDALREMGALSAVENQYDWFKEDILSFEPESVEIGLANHFRRAANQFPNHLAIDAPHQKLSYETLDIESDKIALWITQQNLNTDLPIAVGTKDSVLHVIAILGILKAGGFYIAISHTWPEAKQTQTLAAISSPAFLTSDINEFHNPLDDIQVTSISELLLTPKATSYVLKSPSKYCCIIFTSGSEGEPKGVVQNQANILHNTMWQTNALRISSKDKLSQLHPEGSMGAIRATFNALLNGATLSPFMLQGTDLSQFQTWLSNKKPSILHSSASLFRSITRALLNDELFSSVRLMILGGEAVIEEDYDLFSKRFPENSLFCTGLGSSETTTVRMMLLPRKLKPPTFKGRLPLGYVKPGFTFNLEAKINENLDSGFTGEIIIESEFLFSGYWPLDEKNQIKMTYATGDLGHRAENGLVYHIGRNDQQIKIRGHRIDLLAIENRVRAITGVLDCALVSDEEVGSDARYFVFAVPKDDDVLSTDKVSYFLRKQFPIYAQPAKVFLVGQLPRESGGKVSIPTLRNYLVQQRRLEGDLLEPHKKDLETVALRLFECLEKTNYPFLKRWAQFTDFNKPVGRLLMSDLDIDSLTALEICLNIEEEFRVDIIPTNIFKFQYFGDLLEEIKRRAEL